MVTTNSQANSENFESVWLYTNSGTNSLPDFNFVSKSFLQEEMIDLGELLRRIVKYLVEGIMVAIAAYAIPKKSLNLDEVLLFPPSVTSSEGPIAFLIAYD